MTTIKHNPPVSAFCSESRLSYLSAGSGDQTILLIHGLGSFKEIWLSTIAALAPHAHVLAPDLPGHGESPLDGARSLAETTRRVAAFCTARGLQQIDLVGHSMGGHIALDLTLATPQLVRRLSLVGPAIGIGAATRFRMLPLHTTHGWAALRLSMALARGLGLLGAPHANTLRGVIRPALRRFGYWGRSAPEALHALLDDLITSQLETRVGELSTPLLVLSGALDPLIDPARSQALAQAAQGHYRAIPRAGHAPMEEQPHAFEQELLAFLTAS